MLATVPTCPASRGLPCLSAGMHALSGGWRFNRRPCSKPGLDIELCEDIASDDGCLDNSRRQHGLQLFSIEQLLTHQNSVQQKFPQKASVSLDHLLCP